MFLLLAELLCLLLEFPCGVALWGMPKRRETSETAQLMLGDKRSVELATSQDRSLSRAEHLLQPLRSQRLPQDFPGHSKTSKAGQGYKTNVHPCLFGCTHSSRVRPRSGKTFSGLAFRGLGANLGTRHRGRSRLRPCRKRSICTSPGHSRDRPSRNSKLPGARLL